MRPDARSPVWPRLGIALALAFISVASWLFVQARALRGEIDVRAARIRALGDVAALTWDVNLATRSHAAERMGLEPDEYFAGRIAALELALDELEATDGIEPRLASTVATLRAASAALRLRYAEYERALRAGEAGAADVGDEFSAAADVVAQGVAASLRVERAHTAAVALRLSDLWDTLEVLALVACGLALGSAWLLRSNQRRATELDRTRNALTESRSRLQTVVSSAPVALWAVDRDGTITLSEGRGLEGLGLRPGQLVGQNVFDLYADHAEIRGNVERALDGAAFTALVEIDDTWMQCAYYPVRTESGAPDGALGVAVDVTQAKQAETQLAIGERRRVESQRVEAVGRLAGGVAHEFSNLLTVIGGYGVLARDGLREGDRARADIEKVLHASHQAERLTKQLLAFSHSQIVEPRVLDVVELVRETAGMLRRLLTETVEVRTLLPDRPLLARIDEGQIEQVLVNLAVNARDAMPDGGVLAIEVSGVVIGEDDSNALPDLGTGRYVRLSITDDGVGMTEGVRRHAFEPFFTTKERGKGTGLGLATCYGIVKQSDGHIHLESAPGGGTACTILLPRESAADPEPEVSIPAAAPGAKREGTVLLVEDEALLRSLATRVLVDRGYRVRQAADGIEALRVFEEHGRDVDLVVTDLIMPRLGGRELAERVRAAHPDVQVVYMSGYSEERLPLDERALPGSAFLMKPFSPIELANLVDEIRRERVTSS